MTLFWPFGISVSQLPIFVNWTRHFKGGLWRWTPESFLSAVVPSSLSWIRVSLASFTGETFPLTPLIHISNPQPVRREISISQPKKFEHQKKLTTITIFLFLIGWRMHLEWNARSRNRSQSRWVGWVFWSPWRSRGSSKEGTMTRPITVSRISVSEALVFLFVHLVLLVGILWPADAPVWGDFFSRVDAMLFILTRTSHLETLAYSYIPSSDNIPAHEA